MQELEKCVESAAAAAKEELNMKMNAKKIKLMINTN